MIWIFLILSIVSINCEPFLNRFKKLRKEKGISKDLGYANFNCDTKAGNPTNVNEVRPADIKIVAALGDSLTIARSANATTLTEAVLEYRGLSFMIGGDKKLEDHITIPNILKKFNPDLFGQSYGITKPLKDPILGKLPFLIRTLLNGVMRSDIPSANSWDQAQLNAAATGATALNMFQQAQDLVQRMKKHLNESQMQNDWKLIQIFVGGNDICIYCADKTSAREYSNVELYKQHLEKAIQYLYENVPRAIVSVIGMVNLQVVKQFHLKRNDSWCDWAFNMGCGCSWPNVTDYFQQVSREHQNRVMEIQNEGRFDNDTFTVVVQPAFEGILQPTLNQRGEYDDEIFSYDCFHYSQYAHSLAAKIIWNNLVQPVGSKITNYDLGNAEIPLECPAKDCPYIRTVQNSKHCNTA